MEIFSDVTPFLTKCLSFYWLFLTAFLLELVEILKFFHPRVRTWIDKDFPHETRKKFIKWILIVGFPISSYLAYHDTRNELRASEQSFETYRVQHSLIKTEEEKKRAHIKENLFKFYRDVTFLILNGAIEENDIPEYSRKAGRFIEDTQIWIRDNIGPGAQGKFMNLGARNSNLRSKMAINDRHNNIIQNLKTCQRNLEEIITSDAWLENSSRR